VSSSLSGLTRVSLPVQPRASKCKEPNQALEEPQLSRDKLCNRSEEGKCLEGKI
jgi:hypothetical protein